MTPTNRPATAGTVVLPRAMEPSMSSTKKPCVTKLSRPAADASCTLARTVDRSGLSLGVWSCSSPSPGEPLDEPPRVAIAPEIVRIGRRNWRFWFVSRRRGARRRRGLGLRAGLVVQGGGGQPALG
jgi:hypothetical protein